MYLEISIEKSGPELPPKMANLAPRPRMQSLYGFYCDYFQSRLLWINVLISFMLTLQNKHQTKLSWPILSFKLSILNGSS